MELKFSQKSKNVCSKSIKALNKTAKYSVKLKSLIYFLLGQLLFDLNPHFQIKYNFKSKCLEEAIEFRNLKSQLK
jgi:hypothetical protein